MPLPEGGQMRTQKLARILILQVFMGRSVWSVSLIVLVLTGLRSPVGLTQPRTAETSYTRALKLVKAAEDAFKRGDYNKALTLSRQATTINPRYVRAHTWLGAIYERRGQIAQARQAYQHVLALAPNTPDASHARRRLSLLLEATRGKPVAPTSNFLPTGSAAFGRRILFDAARVTDAQWKRENGITVRQQGAQVVFQNGAAVLGVATVDESSPIHDMTTVDVAIESVVNGRLIVQAEWFRADGTFISATPVLAGTKGGEAVKQESIRRFFPQGEVPTRIRFKFWLEGTNAVATLGAARVSAPRKLLKIFSTTSARQDDPGMISAVQQDVLLLTLKPHVEYSAVVLTEQVDYYAKGMVKLNLRSIQRGGLTVQAICLDNTNKILTTIPLLRDVTKAGLYEAAFETFQKQVPQETAKVTFKVWLAGRGAQGQVASLCYGLTP
jgi:hypothetical protein